MEYWKDIFGYEGLYQISNLGNVKSLSKKSVYKNNRFKILPELTMVQRISNTGYKRVGLVKNGHQTQMSVHRLMAFVFLGNEEKKDCVNHKDGNRLNNNITNLEWVTQSENLLHASRVLKTLVNDKGAKDSQSKAVYQISLINGRVIAKFGSIREATREVGIRRGAISNCANGKYKTGLGYAWSFDQSEPIEDYSPINAMA